MTVPKPVGPPEFFENWVSRKEILRRLKLLMKLENLWSLAPGQRLGQLLCNMSQKMNEDNETQHIDPFFITDDQLEAEMDKWIAELERHQREKQERERQMGSSAG